MLTRPSWVTLVALLSLATSDAFAGHIRRSNGPTVQDSYIIVLKPGTNRSTHIEEVTGTFSISDVDNSITVHRKYSKALNGYSAKLKGWALDRIIADPGVEYVEEDSIASIFTGVPSPATHALVDAFGRRSTTATNGTDGTGVDIYGIGRFFVFAEDMMLIKDADTGIYIEHNDFGGRASWGATFGGYSDVDDNGHGTHTASTAVGAQYGIAKAATVVAVKVLGAEGNGAYSDIIAGIEWVMNAASKSGKPSIANMSLGGYASESMDQAVKNAIAAGIHFAVAAGNAAMDADNTSPARVPAANTVGAVDRTNEVASFSNIGPDLDVFALGVDVQAAWNDGPDSVNTLSGTSMASPRVAGFLAVALSRRSGDTTPASLSSSLTSNAAQVVHGQPSNTTNLLAQMFS